MRDVSSYLITMMMTLGWGLFVTVAFTCLKRQMPLPAGATSKKNHSKPDKERDKHRIGKHKDQSGERIDLTTTGQIQVPFPQQAPSSHVLGGSKDKNHLVSAEPVVPPNQKPAPEPEEPPPPQTPVTKEEPAAKEEKKALEDDENLCEDAAPPEMRKAIEELIEAHC